MPAKIKFQEEKVMVRFYNNENKQIRMEEYGFTDKMDSEEYVASESKEPYAVAFGKHEYSIDFKGVDPVHRKTFDTHYQAQDAIKTFKNPTMMNITSYCYGTDGKPKEDTHFVDCYIEEISGTNNEPFDVKIKALTRLPVK